LANARAIPYRADSGPGRVGFLRLRLLLRESRGLKDKRSVVNSIKGKLRSRFNVSVAEIDSLDNRQVAEIGVALVSNDSRHIEGVLAKVRAFVASNPFAELVESDIEIT
jgi:uncharacterized protein YlxP (DUF503 family)